jgi:uncharacterized protein
MMIKRMASQRVELALARQAAVALTGPRQVGKTTLALEIGATRGAVYLDLESAVDRRKLAEPAAFFQGVEDQLVILDEIHRMPEIFSALRGVIDKGRRRGKGKGRFLALGSASLDLLRQSSESLAGRITYVEMTGLQAQEVPGQQQQLWVRGGFPDAFLAANDRDSFEWRQDFIRTYLERDVVQFGPQIPATTLERLWTMIANLQGTPVNASRLAQALEVSAQSITRYVDLLVDLLLIRRLPAYAANTSKRLVKAPKVYVRDSGLLHALLGIDHFDKLMGHPVVGESWEGFVVEAVLNALPWRTNAFYYRTQVGAEVDLVLEHGDGTLWAIEIKRSLQGKVRRGFHEAVRDLKPARTFLVYAGEDRVPLPNGMEAVGVMGMVELLRVRG